MHIPSHAGMGKRAMATDTRQSDRTALFVLLVVWAIASLYVFANLHRGWIPHDEGTYAGSGVRILAGQLPHRDFDDLYTGGLGLLNAFAFRAFGANLFSMRIPLFIFFVASVPAMFYVLQQWTSPWVAGAATLLAAVYTLPNYSAAVPSWYNLFFALYGLASLFRYMETQGRIWLFLAGVSGGLSILIKISGLYFVAGVLLFFLFRLQEQELGSSDNKGKTFSPYWLSIGLALILFVGFLSWMVRNTIGIEYTYHFVVPEAFLCGFLAWRALHIPRVGSIPRMRSLVALVIPFGAGVLLPILIFLIPYALTHSLASLLLGAFVLPQKHLLFSTMDPPALEWSMATLAVAALIGVTAFLRGMARLVFSVAAAAGLLIILVESARSVFLYRATWRSASVCIPIVVAFGVFVLCMQKRWISLESSRSQQLFLLLAVLALCSLIQFPFASPIYFCYVAPLVVLSLVALFSLFPDPPRVLLPALMVFYLFFAVFRTAPGFIYTMGFQYRPNEQTHPLVLPRAGGLEVGPSTSAMYSKLIPIVEQHAAGDYIYAAPDCPEVYFLSGRRNPTRTFFDFFDDPAGRTARILNAVAGHDVSVVVFASDPSFSKPIAPDLRAALEERYPQSTTVGRFEIRWR